MKIIIDDKIPYIREAAARLGEACLLPAHQINPDTVRHADALIIRTRTRCDRTLLEGSQVRFIATATIGHDHIDTRYLHQAGIAWTNCPGCNASSVAQYVACTLLLLEAEGHLPPQREHCCVGIVGVGHVGKQVSSLLQAMGYSVLLCDPPRAEREGPEAFCTLEHIACEANVITFHTPLTASGPHPTLHMADSCFFSSLCRKPVIINSSRGEVVDTDALLQAEKLGKTGPLVIDTWENEPNISRSLLERAYIATPHIAGYSADGKACGTRMALSAVARHFGMPDQFNITVPELPEHFVALPPALRQPGDKTFHMPHPLGWYDPRRDSRALRAWPEGFEHLRGNYPLRREPSQDCYAAATPQ